MSKKQKKKPRANGASENAGPGDQATAILRPPPDRAYLTPDGLDDLRDQRDRAAKSMDRLSVHDMHGRRTSMDKADRLTAAVDLAELELTPLAPPPSAIQFTEAVVPLKSIDRTGNHRESDDDLQTTQLARSMQTFGLQQRIGLRDAGDGRFELIWGSRRLGSAARLLWPDIPAKVYPQSLTPADVEILRTIENFGRRELSHVERAIAIARILDSIETTLKPLTDWTEQAMAVEFDPAKFDTKKDAVLLAAYALQQDIAKAGGLHGYVGRALGFPGKWVSDHAYVAQLGGECRSLLASRRIDIGHARELAKLGDPKLADQIGREVCRDVAGLGGKDIDYTRRKVVESLRSLRVVPWRLDVAFGAGKPGCTGNACVKCPFNSKSDPDLFGGVLADEPEAGFCTNESCFVAKTEITEKDLAKAAAAAVKKSAKDEDFRATETEMLSIVPNHVKPASAARKAKKEIEATAVDRGTKFDDKKPTAEGVWVDRSKTPAGKFDAAMKDWDRATLDLLEDAVLAVPARLAVLALLQAHPGFNPEDLDTDEDVAKMSDLLDPAIKCDVLAVARSTAAAMLDRPNNWGPNIPVLDGYPAVGLLSFLAKAWAPKAKPMPRLSDFQPKAKPDPEPPKSPPAGGKKKGGKKPADPTPAAEVDEFKVGQAVQSKYGGRKAVVSHIHLHNGTPDGYYVRWEGTTTPDGLISPNDLVASTAAKLTKPSTPKLIDTVDDEEGDDLFDVEAA